MIKIQIKDNQVNKRVDVALSENTEFSRSMIQKIIISGNLFCNGEKILKPNKKTTLNEVYELTPIKFEFHEITPEKYELDILFEDEHLIVINKPAELIVHPGAGNFDNTLINKLAYHCTLSDINGPEKLGTVHRLDKGVSGCIIFAKDNATHMHLNNQFATRQIKKKYFALSHGTKAQLNYFVEDCIARSRTNRKKMKIYENHGKLSQMNFSIKKTIIFDKQIISLIECSPITGRMHQIRVQLSQRNLPIINDNVYGITENKTIKEIFKNRIALHASDITFTHPKSNEKIEIKTTLPKEFSKITNKVD